MLSLYHCSMAQEKPLLKILGENGPFKRDTSFRIHSNEGTFVDIPMTIVKGIRKGPTFTVMAGIHGMEYPTITSLLELREELDPEKLTGNVIIIPVVNMQAFYHRMPFLNPLDKLNLNRVFPGNPSGSISEVMADFLVQEVFNVTDILLDMHGGDVGEDLIPFMCYYDNKEYPQQTELASHLCEASGFQTIVSYPYTLPVDRPALYAFKQAVRMGITALSLEIGKLGNSNDSEILAAKDAIHQMLIELNMVKGRKTSPGTRADRHFNRQAYVPVPVQGIFNSKFKAGDTVERGTVIGSISDIFGKELQKVTAPETGMVLYKVGTPPVNKDETLICIGFNADDAL